MKRSTVGFLLGLFFGILGLLGLLSCNNSAEKEEFMSGWWKVFVLKIILIIIVVCIATCGSCSIIGKR